MERPQTTTMVITPTVTSAREQRTPVVLEANLRILRVPDTRRVTWQEGTIDNEGLQRKNSKCCCIYNKRRQYDGESSDGMLATFHKLYNGR
ncbi:Protein phosphatase 1 regulatory subunit 11 [Babesia sp. Xinjiang]|uniref:Protein phosphatase 1 regulatory subunit 11 n=1 Tax=Babesia sp. Xinjiang TaxID=462227 RepID=UPI000A24CF9B|nr:Protein phosphatase 1 regulatory subunit 11 [Babesia sp. Xinjiang]ORM40230.1 Protein phosphatase 1 regulatory subunit 11 [Babesia sp. Xinjiang]